MLAMSKRSSPIRPVAVISLWKPSSCFSVDGIQDAPCSVSTNFNPGNRSNTPLTSMCTRVRWVKNGISVSMTNGTARCLP